MKKRIELIIRINQEADSEEFYQAAQDLGMRAALALKEEDKHRSQMTGLENIAETTLKVTDVLDYIKKQTARHKGWQMVVGTPERRFGDSLKGYIEGDLMLFLNNVCETDGFITTTTEEGKHERRMAYLEIVRQLIRQIVVQYEYQTMQLEETKRR